MLLTQTRLLALVLLCNVVALSGSSQDLNHTSYAYKKNGELIIKLFQASEAIHDLERYELPNFSLVNSDSLFVLGERSYQIMYASLDTAIYKYFDFSAYEEAIRIGKRLRKVEFVKQLHVDKAKVFQLSEACNGIGCKYVGKGPHAHRLYNFLQDSTKNK